MWVTGQKQERLLQEGLLPQGHVGWGMIQILLDYDNEGLGKRRVDDARASMDREI